MTKNGTISHFVTPAKAGVQASQGFFNGLLGDSLDSPLLKEQDEPTFFLKEAAVMRFGLNVWLWVSPFTTEKMNLVGKVADMGFDWIEFGIESTSDIDYEKVGAAIQERDLGVSVCAVIGPDRDLTIYDPEINKKGVEYLKHCVDAVVTLGGNRVVGPIYAAVGRTWQSDSAQRRVEMDRCANHLREVGNYAGDKGVVFGLEALNRFETSFITTTD